MERRPTRPARLQRTQHLFAATIPAVVVVLSITGFVWAQRSVTIVADGETARVATRATEVSGVLADAGIDVGAHDLVTPRPDAALRDGDTIVVRRAVPVVLKGFGEPIEIQVRGENGRRRARLGGYRSH